MIPLRNLNRNGSIINEEVSFTCQTSTGCENGLMINKIIRRLTPRECERLQGFPDDWTLVPIGNGMMSDTQRYKQMGNAVTVNVITVIGERILQSFIES